MTTTGLEWNLGPNDCAFTRCETSPSRLLLSRERRDAYGREDRTDMYPTSLSTAVSTSNHLIQEDVTVETDVPVIWTMEVRGGAD